ncbi:MAG: hypothetical protein AAF990_14305 [Bacteroidota bacterium]
MYPTRSNKIYLWLFGLLLLAACKNEPQNGLLNSLTMDGVQYVARYNAVQSSENSHHILFRIQPTQSGQNLEKILEQKQSKYSWAMVKNSFDYHLQNAFRLTVDGQELPCRFYHAIPALSDQQGQEFVLVFENHQADVSEKTEQNLILEFDDQYFSGESLQLIFNRESFNQLAKF